MEQNSNFLTHQQPLDCEALPFPSAKAPEVIKLLVSQLPPCWQQTAALALLPALATAASRVTYENYRPLAFHVAVFGLAGSGKSQFTCKPAQLVQDYIARMDQIYRQDNSKCPKLIGFETSIVQLSKYLQKSNDEMTMLYTDEISQAVSTNNGFLQLQPILRKGFDGISHTMDYKDRDSFRGTIKPRISFLACGTPNTLFKYFDQKAIEEGTTRRVIFVEHPVYDGEPKQIQFTKEQWEAITKEIEFLEQQNIDLNIPEIEKAALKWKNNYKKQIKGDMVAQLMLNTPTDLFKRGAYLAYTLNHYQNLNNAVSFGKWIAEYMLRAAINLTLQAQRKIADEGKKYFTESTQNLCKDFNDKMLQELPEQFKFQDVIDYRNKNGYSGDPCNPNIISRWIKRNKIKIITKGLYQKA
jgi:hypothetical protein